MNEIDELLAATSPVPIARYSEKGPPTPRAPIVVAEAQDRQQVAPQAPKRWARFDAAEARYRPTARWIELVEVYLEWLEQARSRDEKAELLRRIGRVMCEELDDAPQALDAFVESLLLEPSDEATVIALEAIANALAAWTSTIRTVEAQLDKIAGEGEEDGAARHLALCEHLVRWNKTYLGKRDAAEKFVARIRVVDPAHSAIHARLASVYREHGAFDSQRIELERALLSAKSSGERRLLHLALAELSEQRFADLPTATRHYESALVIDPRALDALLGLERLYRAQTRFFDLVRVLEKEIEAAPAASEERVAPLLRLAELHERQFVKPQLAAPLLEEAITIAPDNADAFTALERCYHAMRAWSDLVRTLEAHAKVTREVDADEKVTLIARAAEVHETKLGDPNAAMAVYRRLFDSDNRHVTALTELARLSERAQDWKGAASYRARLADLAPSAEARARLHVAIGEMLAPADRNPGLARLHLEHAASIHPGCGAAWEALERDARRENALDRVATYLEKRAEHTESPRLRAQLLVQLAEARTELGENAAASLAYEQAIAADPANEAAAEVMLARTIEAKRWVEAQPLCDLLVNAALRDGDDERAFTLMRSATRIAAARNDEERALTLAMTAYRARPSSVALEDIVEVCHRARADASMIARVRRTLDDLASATEELSPGSLAKLGEIWQALGVVEAAVALFSQALSLDSKCKTALAGCAEIAIARHEWAQAADFKERLAHATSDADARFTLLLESGELWAHRAGDLPQAARAFEDALKLRPRDHWLLHTLMWLYGEVQQWEELVRILRGVAEVEEEPSRRAKSIFAMALVLRDEIADLPRAASVFEEVLDLDPTRLDAFERVVRIHTEHRDWNELKRAYERMLGRVSSEGRVTSEGDVELRHALHFQLGLIYRDRLGDALRALDAFRAAAQLNPANDEARKIVCELLVITGQIDKAIEAARRALASRPEEASIYGDLYDLLSRQRAFDKAWCVLDAMNATGGSFTADQRQFYSAWETVPLRVVRVRLPAAIRLRLLHPELEASLTAIFACIMPAVLRARRAVVPEHWLSKALGAPLEPTTPSAKRVLSALHTCCDILGTPVPPLYARKTSAPLAPTPTMPSMFVSLEACDAMTDRALAFAIGKRLAEQQPELAARAVFPTLTELTALLRSAVEIVRGQPPAADANVAFQQALRVTITSEERDSLRTAIAAASAKGSTLDVARWLQLADASTSRMGLLLAGSAEAARRAMIAEPQSPGDPSLRERLNELLIFAVSDAYADLRGLLGIAANVAR